MRVAHVLAVGVLVAFPGGVRAADCAKFMQAFTEQHKMIGQVMVEGVADNSAPRATLRELRISNLQSAMQMNLTLMVHAKCSLPSSPIWVSDYMLSAMQCEAKSADCKPMSQWSKMDRDQKNTSQTAVPAPIQTEPRVYHANPPQ